MMNILPDQESSQSYFLEIRIILDNQTQHTIQPR